VTGPSPEQRRSTAEATDGFAGFVGARTPALLRSAFLLTGDQHTAEDLVQSALARTHRGWHRLHSTGNAEAYTRKIMYHLQVSWWRRRRVSETPAGHLPEPRRADGGDHAADTVLRLSVREALARLTAKQRAVLVLRFFEDASEAEAAEVLGVSVGTIKSQTVRALARLRAVAPELREFADGSDAPVSPGGTR
jgi:RNA polymerase sigma-70 factor (sigma-E family)